MVSISLIVPRFPLQFLKIVISSADSARESEVGGGGGGGYFRNS